MATARKARARKRPAATVPLDVTLEQYYSSCAVIGLLSAQLEEPAKA